MKIRKKYRKIRSKESKGKINTYKFERKKVKYRAYKQHHFYYKNRRKIFIKENEDTLPLIEGEEGDGGVIVDFKK
ncbi:MAG: hypothetical protein IJC76_08045 [Lachnospiraceae bacterium]|nr:hypothetical protein [Lachnospiraceae bacterium]MEE1255061.1 hypothetical protein [Lachnospiraceae bacterium]